MPRDYARFVPPKTRTSQRKTRRLQIFIVIFFVMASAAGLGGYVFFGKLNQHILADNAPKGQFISKIIALFTAKPQKTISIVQNAKAKAVDQPAIQFDFYDELPNLHMAVAAHDNNIVTAERSANPEKIVAKLEKIPDANPKTNIETPKVVAKLEKAPEPTLKNHEEPLKSQPIVQADEIEHALADEKPVEKKKIFNPDELTQMINQAQAAPPKEKKQYILQLGTFESSGGAKRLVTAISYVGFDAKVVRVELDKHIIYRVEHGPFDTMDGAKLGQQRLQKRGIVSIIRKLA